MNFDCLKVLLIVLLPQFLLQTAFLILQFLLLFRVVKECQSALKRSDGV